MRRLQPQFKNTSSSALVDSADFDGTNDYAQRGAELSGSTDSKLFTLSFWHRIDGGDASARRIFTNGVSAIGSAFSVSLNTSNQFAIAGANAASAVILNINSSAYVAGPTWRHVLISCDMANAASRHIYINDSSDLATVTTYTNDTIDNTRTQWTIGAHGDASQKMNGCLAELWFTQGVYTDFSIVDNRRKFISSSLRPVYLGNSGELPTGTSPICFHHLADAETVANFALNRGTGGNFTITGTLDTGSTSPSD